MIGDFWAQVNVAGMIVGAALVVLAFIAVRVWIYFDNKRKKR